MKVMKENRGPLATPVPTLLPPSPDPSKENPQIQQNLTTSGARIPKPTTTVKFGTPIAKPTTTTTSEGEREAVQRAGQQTEPTTTRAEVKEIDDGMESRTSSEAVCRVRDAMCRAVRDSMGWVINRETALITKVELLKREKNDMAKRLDQHEMLKESAGRAFVAKQSVVTALQDTIKRQSGEIKAQQQKLQEAQDEQARLREQDGVLAALRAEVAAATAREHFRINYLLEELEKEKERRECPVSAKEVLDGLSQEVDNWAMAASSADAEREIVALGDPAGAATYWREQYYQLRGKTKGDLEALRGRMQASVKQKLEVLKEEDEDEEEDDEEGEDTEEEEDPGERASKRLRTQEPETGTGA